MLPIKHATTAEDIIFCSKAILTFRQDARADQLVRQTLSMMNEGFQLIYIPNDDQTGAAAFAGFRNYEMYRGGRMIYIDDLFTFPENRKKGYAGALLDYIHGLAGELNISTVHLDSGYDLHPAHRLYLNKGYVLTCHHFSKKINIDS